MSIASRITSIEEHIGNAYDSIKKFGVDTSVINRNIENIANVINDDIYDKLPKVTQSGAGLTITPVQNGQVDDFKMIGTNLYQNQLPSEYTAVEYLQSDNECYIDTGINADYKLSLKIKTACLNSTQQHMGAINNTGSAYIRHHITFNPSQPQDIGIYIGQTNNQLSLKSFDNNFHEFNLDIYNKKVSIDNDSPISISYNNFDVGINYYLFARNGSNIAISKGSYKIAYCKMYYEDNLVRDFAPCYRNSDNVAGLYDFVTNTFFTNQGTGTFTVGNNITLPNPNYPQEIKVVDGRQVIIDNGKNLFDKNNANIMIASFSQDYKKISQVSNNAKILYIPCKGNTTYTVSKKSSERFRILTTEIVPALEVAGIDFIQNETATSLTITTSSNVNYLCVYYFINGTDTLTEQEILDSIQIEENSSATDYESYYNPVGYNIDLTNDLLKYSKCDFTPTTTSWYFLDSSGSAYGSNIGTKTDIKFPVEINKKYTFRYNISTEFNSFQLCYENENIVATLDKSSGNKSFTFTSNRNGYVIPRVRVQANSQVKITDISVVEGEEDYYDYKLAKIPNTDYKNRIYKNNGNWYYEKNIEKVILNGSENWSVRDDSNIGYLFQLKVNDIVELPNSETLGTIIANRLPTSTPSQLWTNNINGISNLNNGKYLRVRIQDSPYTTVNDFKNWLSTHNVEVWYPLATPVTTQITNTTLINQLEAISVHTGTNIITISNDNNIIPEIEITRLKELEKLS